MNFKTIPIEKLNPAPYNPRVKYTKNDLKYKQLEASLNEIGYIQPIIWNKNTGNIVGGHFRYQVLKDKGEKEIECIVVNYDETNEKQANLMLNKIEGDFDESKLAALFADLDSLGADLEITGFDENEIEDLLAPKTALQDNFDEEKHKNEIEAKGSIIQSGDIICLGNHRIICGDSTDSGVWDRILEGKKCRLVVTSPPYGIGLQYASTKECDNDEDWFKLMLPVIKNITVNTEVAVVNVADAFASKTQFIRPLSVYSTNMFLDNGFRPLYIRLWLKQGQNFGHMTHLSTLKPVQESEWIIAYTKDGEEVSYQEQEFSFITAFAGHSYKFVKYLTKQERREWGYSQTWKIPTVKSNDVHRAMFPPELPRRIIKMHTTGNNIVCDCFSGSGTTMIACEETGRIYRGIEIEPTYCELSARRYMEFTGDIDVYILRNGKQLKFL